MGTRTSIRIENNEKYICSKYINMDGHVKNWAPILITALNQTSPKEILKNRQLLKFMCDDYFGADDMLSYLCIVDISNNKYKITIKGYDKLLFEGTLEDFSEKYDEIY